MTTANYVDLKSMLADTESDRPTRMRRLQGWRGADLDAAVSAGNAHRIAPATCATLALIVAFTASLPLALVALASAIIGVFAAHHPIESAYNMIARRRGGNTLPANRAAKRLGCLIGATFFAASSTAFVLDYDLAGQIIAGVMAAVAAFVAVTDICIPSLFYTLVLGDRRASCPLIFKHQ